MVDFGNETTVTVPPGEVVKIVVLERREQVIEALESYHFTDAVHGETTQKEAALKSRIMAFWYQVQAMVKRRLKDRVKDYDDIEYAVREAKTYEELVVVFEWLNEFVDDMGLTVIDGREKYDRRRIEDANSKKGL